MVQPAPALVQGLVVGGDAGQRGALPGGQALRFLPQRPHPGAERGGLVLVPGGAQLRRRGGGAARRVARPPISRHGRRPGRSGPAAPSRGRRRGSTPPRRRTRASSSADRSLPSASKNAVTVSWLRPSVIQAIFPETWSVTTVRYFPAALAPGLLVDADHPQALQPVQAGRGVPATRATMLASASHVTRSSADAFVQGICAASQAE